MNPAVNLAAIKSYDEILRETLNILKEYDDVVERIWDGDLFFMNYDVKETTPLLKVFFSFKKCHQNIFQGITDRVEGGTIDLVVKMVNAVIFQTKLDPIFAADQEATLFHEAKKFIRPKYKTQYLLKYFEYYDIENVLDKAREIFTGNEVSNFPQSTRPDPRHS